MEQKGFINIAVIVIVFLLAGVGVYFVLNHQVGPTPTPGDRIVESVTVNGEIICLPKIGSESQTIECAIGLRGLDGRQYGLKNLSKYDTEYKFSQTGLGVEVSGIFSPEEMKGPDGNNYDVVGTIDITSIKEVIEPNGALVSLHEGQRESSFLLEKIYPDHVTGLNFWEYPVATDKGYSVTLRIGEMVSNGCTVTLTLTRIEGGTATFIKKTDFSRPCPICLASGTLIDTPTGSVPVKDLQIGMSIWTIDKSGNRVMGVVQKTSKVAVPLTHQMVHLVLRDGRELFVSPGHPTTDGRNVHDLVLGELYDGSSVTGLELVPYGEGATYDVLPSGETGFYWANGVLLGSTLHAN